VVRILDGRIVAEEAGDGEAAASEKTGT
jgi:hypothetical protein